VGYFLVQQVAAGRCDEELGGKAFVALHSRLETRFEKQVGQARSVRAKFFQRAYGESGVQELDRVNTLMIDLFNSTVSATAENCGKLKAELDRRLTVAWSEIQERLERRVASIAPTDKGICKE